MSGFSPKLRSATFSHCFSDLIYFTDSFRLKMGICKTLITYLTHNKAAVILLNTSVSAKCLLKSVDRDGLSVFVKDAGDR